MKVQIRIPALDTMGRRYAPSAWFCGRVRNFGIRDWLGEHYGHHFRGRHRQVGRGGRGASVTAIDTQTGVKTEVKTDAKGFYSLPALAIGTYNLEVKNPGFKRFKATGLVIDANSALRQDVSLDVGAVNESVDVRTDAVHVETQ